MVIFDEANEISAEGPKCNDDCAYYSNVSSCSPSCTYNSCTNSLNTLHLFFGKPCFQDWLKHRIGGLVDLTDSSIQELLRSMIMNVRIGDKTVPPKGDIFEQEGRGWNNDEMRQLAKDWVKAGVTRDEREEVMRMLFRAAVGQTDHFKI